MPRTRLRVGAICPSGHRVVGENAYITPDGYTRCRLCKRARDNSWRAATGSWRSKKKGNLSAPRAPRLPKISRGVILCAMCSSAPRDRMSKFCVECRPLAAERRRERQRARNLAYAKASGPKYRRTHRMAQRARAARLKAAGEIRPGDIRKLMDGQRGRCWWCSRRLGDKFHLDHRIPLAKGGNSDAGIIVLSCPPCNLSKHAKLPHEFCGRLL